MAGHTKKLPHTEKREGERGGGRVCGESRYMYVYNTSGLLSYECDLGPLIRAHVKIQNQETLARFALALPYRILQIVK